MFTPFEALLVVSVAVFTIVSLVLVGRNQFRNQSEEGDDMAADADATHIATDIDEDKFDPATYVMTDEGIQDDEEEEDTWDDEDDDDWGYYDDDFDGDFDDDEDFDDDDFDEDEDEDDLDDGEEDDWGPACHPLDELADDQLCGEDDDEDCPLPVGEWDENPLNKFDVANRFDESRLEDGFIDQYLGEDDND